MLALRPIRLLDVRPRVVVVVARAAQATPPAPEASSGPSALLIVGGILGALLLYEGGKWVLKSYAA